MSRVTRHLGLLVWLVLVWTALWGNLSWANVLGGLVVGLAVLLALPLEQVPRQSRVDPLGVVLFAAVFLVELVQASLQVVALVLRPRGQLRSAVIAVPVHGEGDRLLTLVGNAISLTPGTLTLEVDRARSLLYVHTLDVGEGPDAQRASIARLELAAARALGQSHEVHARREGRR